MSRSGYGYDICNWDLIRWRGRVTSATRGARGQVFFKALAEAMDAMPEKRLIQKNLMTDEGCCAIGTVLKHRGMEVRQADSVWLSNQLDIAECLAKEVMFVNDDVCPYQTPEERWARVRAWVQKEIRPS